MLHIPRYNNNKPVSSSAETCELSSAVTIELGNEAAATELLAKGVADVIVNEGCIALASGREWRPYSWGVSYLKALVPAA